MSPCVTYSRPPVIPITVSLHTTPLTRETPVVDTTWTRDFQGGSFALYLENYGNYLLLTPRPVLFNILLFLILFICISLF